MALGRKTANLLFLQEISLYNVTFSEGQNFLKKKKSVSTAVVWKRECNSLLVKKMENFLIVWNGSATSAETAAFQIQTWFPYCTFCKDSHTTIDTHCLLITASAGKATLQVPTLFPYYCLYRESHTTITLVVSVLPWWLRGIFNRYTFN